MSLILANEFYNSLIPLARSGALQYLRNRRSIKHRYCGKCSFHNDYSCRIGSPKCFWASVQHSICKDCSSLPVCENHIAMYYERIGCIPPQERERKEKHPMELTAYIINEQDEHAQSYLCSNWYSEPLTIEYFKNKVAEEIEMYAQASINTDLNIDTNEDDPWIQEAICINEFIKEMHDSVKKQERIEQDALYEYNDYLKRKKYFEENWMEIANKNFEIYYALEKENKIRATNLLKAISPIPLLPERCAIK